jgi:SAM-dependent methyltransferase
MEPSRDPSTDTLDLAWRQWLDRLAQGEWRTPIFYDMVRAEIERRSSHGRPTVLDIGCGKGFDGEVRFQTQLAQQAGRFIGIEPDPAVALPDVFSEVHRTYLEDAPIPAASVDVAYAVMVMEHVATPERFWNRLHEVLAPGGVFLAFSVNGAHWFAFVSRLLGALHLKTAYLNLLHGRRGAERYEDYPVFYRTNTARRIKRWTAGFSEVAVVPCGPVGQVAYYAPAPLQGAVRLFDRLVYRLVPEPMNLAIRAVK